MKKLSLAFTLSLLAVCVVAFQNCGFGAGATQLTYEQYSLLEEDIGSTIDTTPSNPAGPSAMDKVVTNCLNLSTVEGCTFKKNPVAHSGQTISTTTAWYDAIASRQTLSFNLRGLSGTGYLENSSVKVMGAGGDAGSQNRLMKNSSTQWRYPVTLESAAASKGNAATQVSAYYWLNLVGENLAASPLISRVYTQGNPVTVYPYVLQTSDGAFKNASYIFGGTRANSMLIGYGELGVPLAFSGDVIIHELGHAFVHQGSAGNTGNISTSTTQYCLTGVGGLTQAQIENSGLCCKSEAGCISAMNEGLADYFAGITFPENPTVGEAYMNDINGFTTCGAGTPYRDPRKNVSRTPASVFNLCKANINRNGVISQVPKGGEAYTMATVYTSILWEIRKKMQQSVATQSVGGKSITGAALAEAIVYEHLQSLTGSSTFSSSRLGLKNAASALVTRLNLSVSSSTLSSIIDAEFARRGIN